MTAKVVRFSDWCDPERYHGFRPPRSDTSWSETRKIYLLRASEFVKIGVATDVQKRVNQLRSGCPYPIEIVSVRTAPNAIAFQVERRVHRHFAAHQASGEWFRLDATAAKEVIHLEIRLAKAAMERWLRDGYREWNPA